jgi:hypothetical protein
VRTRNIFRSSVILGGVIIILQLPLSAGQKTINYQGKLTNASGAPVTSTSPMTVTFKLYNSSGTQVWAESQGVTFSSGLFNVTLGKGTSLDGLSFSEQYSLGIQMAGDTAEMTPRQPLSASSYALGSLGDFNIKQNLNVGGIINPNGKTMLSSVEISSNATLTGKVTMVNIEVSGSTKLSGKVSMENVDVKGNATIMGSAGIGTTNPSSSLTIEKAPLSSLLTMLELSGGSHLYHPPEGSGMQIQFKDSDNTNPVQEIASIGYVRVGSVWQSDLFFRTKNTSAVVSEAMRITGNGDIGIGTASPANKLHVAASGGSGITIGKPYDSMQLNVPLKSETGRYNLNFYTWRDVVPDQIGAQIAVVRSNNYQDNNALVQAASIAFLTGSGWGEVNEVMRIGGNGLPNVSIGQAYGGDNIRLTVNGNFACSASYISSDIRLKTDISKINNDDLISKIGKLEGIKYRFDKSELKKMNGDRVGNIMGRDEDKKYEFCDKVQIGLSAQELEKDFPELVMTDQKGYKSVNYSAFSVILLEAIKNQQKEIDKLKQVVSGMQKK